MRITTRGRYGLKMMADIAQNGGESAAVSIKSVAGRTRVSEKYLERLASVMLSGGFLKSIRGKGGGYMLANPADDISVARIISAFEGDLAPECEEETGCSENVSCDSCAARDVMLRINASWAQAVGDVCLSDLVREAGA